MAEWKNGGMAGLQRTVEWPEWLPTYHIYGDDDTNTF
jgi:hypothetical protein